MTGLKANKAGGGFLIPAIVAENEGGCATGGRFRPRKARERGMNPDSEHSR